MVNDDNGIRHSFNFLRTMKAEIFKSKALSLQDKTQTNTETVGFPSIHPSIQFISDKSPSP